MALATIPQVLNILTYFSSHQQGNFLEHLFHQDILLLEVAQMLLNRWTPCFTVILFNVIMLLPYVGQY